MRRLPLFPTLVVALAVTVMVALGVWQLQRAAWKSQLIADYAAAAALPALDLDPLLDSPTSSLPPLAFRRVLVTCSVEDAEPVLRGARNRLGQGGYGHFIPCRPGAAGLAGRITVNAGWSAMPDADRRLSLSGPVAGTLGMVADGEPVVLTAATAATPLQPATAPSIGDIPNNHVAYAFQWFFFAGAALLIYLLALRQRRRDLPPGPSAPTSAAR